MIKFILGLLSIFLWLMFLYILVYLINMPIEIIQYG
jgi:hypothetical protein